MLTTTATRRSDGTDQGELAVTPTVVVTLGYDLPRNPRQLGVRGVVLETLALTGASLQLISALGHAPLDDAFFAAMDGLVLPGGPDPHPSLWGEAVHPTTVIDEPRDRLEYALLRGCIERGIPVLGVCRGLQVINVVRGGTLVQDLPPGPLDHRGPADRTARAVLLEALEAYVRSLEERSHPIPYALRDELRLQRLTCATDGRSLRYPTGRDRAD